MKTNTKDAIYTNTRVITVKSTVNAIMVIVTDGVAPDRTGIDQRPDSVAKLTRHGYRELGTVIACKRQGVDATAVESRFFGRTVISDKTGKCHIGCPDEYVNPIYTIGSYDDL